MSERRFNERELAEILRKAGKRQFAGVRSAEANAFSLEDIQRLAAEVGIDPADIAAEAARLPDRTDEPAGFWGATPSLIRDLTVPCTISEETWEDLVSELRTSLGGVGKVSSTELSREWSGGTELRGAHLAATRKAGQTKLRLTLSQYGGLSLAWAFGFVFTFVAAMVIGAVFKRTADPDPTSLSLAVMTVVGAGLAIVNRSLAGWQSKNRRLLDRVMDRLQTLASATEVGVRESLPEAPVELAAPEEPDLRQRL